jgi:cytochrome c oxidase assembly protein subunit 15
MAGKRSIFEEVAAPPQKAAAPLGGMIDARPKGARHAIRGWLIILFLMVAAMIVVGGLTRLTDSGLSITEWRPVTGAIPPLAEADWAAEFEKYRATPQFALANPQMTLAEFKGIYWWEWGHRQLGRAIGLVWAVGFSGFCCAARSRRAGPGGWCWWARWAGCRARLAGGWCPRADRERWFRWPRTGWPCIWGWPLRSWDSSPGMCSCCCHAARRS